MKKSYLYAMMGAIALTGVVNFSACQSSDEIDVNPTFDGNAVKTSFTISVGDVKNPTRMVADAVQANNAFQGMTDIYLFPAKATINASTVTSESYINLADFSDFDSDVEDATGKIYTDVNLSIGVSNFLFYAATAKANKDNGKLKPSYLSMAKEEFNGTADWDPTPILTNSTVGSITFDLVPIMKDKGLDDIKTAGATTIAPLIAVDAELEVQIPAAASDATAKEILENIQAVLRNDQGATATPRYKPYAGSSQSMLALMTDLYNSLMNKASVLGVYGTKVIDAIKEYFTPDGNATNGYTLQWKDTNLSSTNVTKHFPASLGLPDGAVAVAFSGTAFDYVTPSVDGLEVTAIDRYTYPARLYYTVNTRAMIKNAEYLSSLENTIDTWAGIKSGGQYQAGAIKADTRSVIMEDQVQYAVGRLDVQARVKPATTIMDNTKGTPQPVTIPSGGYKLTGVLIGGQKQVGWDFKPTTTTIVQTIWDNSMTSDDIVAKQQTAYSEINHTLALETASGEAVNIALEFENTGNDFIGIDHNLIPAGSKFYLVAKLTPGQNEIENDNSIDQVFKQDYITTAKLTIGANSLKKAYNVIPDLRSPKLEFGLSVNLEWQKGITFEQEFQ